MSTRTIEVIKKGLETIGITNEFILRPSGIRERNIYIDFDSLYSASQNIDGLKVIYFDPGDGSGSMNVATDIILNPSYELKDYVFKAYNSTDDENNNFFTVNFTNEIYFDSFPTLMDTISFTFNNTIAPVYTHDKTTTTQYIFNYSASLINNGSVEIINVAAGKSLIYYNPGKDDSTGYEIFNVLATGTLTILKESIQGEITNDCFRGAGNVNLLRDINLTYGATQTNHSGVLTIVKPYSSELTGVTLDNVQYVFIFDPSIGASAGNVYNDFDDLYDAAQLEAGKENKIIIFTDSAGGSGTVSIVNTHSSYDFSDYIFIGESVVKDFEFTNEVTFIDWPRSIENVSLTFNNAIASVYTVPAAARKIISMDGGNLKNNGSKTILNLTDATSWLILNINGQVWNPAAYEILEKNNAGVCIFSLISGANIPADSIRGTGAITVFSNNLKSEIDETQTNHSSTLTIQGWKKSSLSTPNLWLHYDGSTGIITPALHNLPGSAAAPTVNDDNTLGYMPGSFWRHSGTGQPYLCVSSSTGAANWKAI